MTKRVLIFSLALAAAGWANCSAGGFGASSPSCSPAVSAIGVYSVPRGAEVRKREGSQSPPSVAPAPLLRTFTVTAYCPCRRCCGRWADGITASGWPVTVNGGRFVAAPRDIPFGTYLVIPGYCDGCAVPVLDRGGAIKGDKLDVFFPDEPGKPGSGHRAALNWGVRELTVRPYGPYGIER